MRLFLFYLMKFHKMGEVHVTNVVFSLMSSAFKEGSNEGGIRTPLTGLDKVYAPYNPT